ncbi:MAG: T9SS type A sorting domain-containing protein [Candidatus Kapaibacterium sp.]
MINKITLILLIFSYILSCDATAQNTIWQHRIDFPLMTIPYINYHTPLIPTSDNNYLLSYNFMSIYNIKEKLSGGQYKYEPIRHYTPYILKFDDLEGKLAFEKTYPDKNMRKTKTGEILEHPFEAFDFIMEKQNGEYWFAGHSYWETSIIMAYTMEFPYFVKTDANGEIINTKNIQKELFEAGTKYPYEKSLKIPYGKLFYEAERDVFIRFVSNMNFLVIEEFDTNFTKISDDKVSQFEFPTELTHDGKSNLLIKKLSNGNYFVLFTFVKHKYQVGYYHGGLYRIYTPDLEIVADKYFDDSEKGELMHTCQIKETKDGNILLVAAYKTEFTVKEITPEFEEISLKTLNFAEEFASKKVTPRDAAFLDNKILFVGVEDTTVFYKASPNDDELSKRQHYKLHFIETDLTCNNQRKFSLDDSFTEPKFVVRPSIDNKTYIVATVDLDTTIKVVKEDYPSWFQYRLHLSKIDFSSSISASDLVTSSSVFPNPIVTGGAQLSLELKQACDVRIVLSDVLGREKLNVFSGFLEEGRFTKSFDVEGLANGIYFIKTSIGDKFIVDKLIINR